MYLLGTKQKLDATDTIFIGWMWFCSFSIPP